MIILMCASKVCVQFKGQRNESEAAPYPGLGDSTGLPFTPFHSPFRNPSM